MYQAVRTALTDAVASGRLTGDRLEEAADRVAALRAWLASARELDRAGAPDAAAGDAIGLLAARRALRRSGPVPGSLARSARGRGRAGGEHRGRPVHLGLRPWAETRRVDPAAGDGAAAGSIIAAAAGRSLVLAVRDGRARSRW